MAVVTKPDLLTELSERAGVSQRKCERVLDALAEILCEAVVAGDEVHHPKLGVFRGHLRPAREFKSGLTGEMQHQPEFLRLTHVPGHFIRRELRLRRRK